MTTIYSNENRGSMFVNDKKTEEKHPDWNGSLNVNGVEFWISGWKKMSKGGKPFLSISIREKQEQARQISQPTRKAPVKDEFADSSDIPW